MQTMRKDRSWARTVAQRRTPGDKPAAMAIQMVTRHSHVDPHLTTDLGKTRIKFAKIRILFPR